MDKKAVTTPVYWQGRYFQPLVETHTLYGNPVKIPERYISNWENLNENIQNAVKLWPVLDPFKYKKYILESMIAKRGWQAADFARVMLEIYVEEGRNPPKDM